MVPGIRYVIHNMSRQLDKTPKNGKTYEVALAIEFNVRNLTKPLK